MDDDRSVRKLLEDFLLREGYRVVVSSTFVDALAKIPEARDAGCRVAIVDGDISNLNDGEEVAKALRDGISGIHIISLSGIQRTWGEANLVKPVFPLAKISNAIKAAEPLT